MSSQEGVRWGSDRGSQEDAPSYMKVATGNLVASLLRDDSDTVPDVFVLRERGQSDEPGPGEEHPSVPIFDLAPLGMEAGTPQRDRLVADIVRSSKEWGCFQVINHGIPAELVQGARQQVFRFFSLPFSQKARIFSPPNSLMGYACGGNRTSGFLWQEGLAISATEESLVDSARKVWPEGNDEFSSVVGAYVKSVSTLAMQLLEILTAALGARDPHFLDKVFVPGSSTVRFNYYLPCPQPSATYGSSPLTDIQVLAIVHPDEVAGLQVKKDGKWIPVHSRADSFVVNIGDALQVFSNDRYVSVEHRAVVNESTTWLTMGYYLTPSDETRVTPPPELVTSEHPQLYKPFTYAEYSTRMCNKVLSPVFKYLGKTTLNRYRLAG